MFRRRRPVRARGLYHGGVCEVSVRNTPKFNFTQIREEVRAVSDVVVSLRNAEQARDSKMQEESSSGYEPQISGRPYLTLT